MNLKVSCTVANKVKYWSIFWCTFDPYFKIAMMISFPIFIKLPRIHRKDLCNFYETNEDKNSFLLKPQIEKMLILKISIRTMSRNKEHISN